MKSLYITISLTLVMMLTSCEKAFFEAEPENNPEALFEDFWNNFNTDYASFKVRGVNWQEVYDTYRPQVSPETTDDELAEILYQLIKIIDDGHVSLTVPGKEIYYSNRIFREEIGSELFDLELLKSKYMNNEYTESGYGFNTYGRIGNIGYLYIEAFSLNLLEMNDILDEFDSAEGLIIDLRANIGGDFTYAITEFSRLTEEERFIFRSRTKKGEGDENYTDWFDWNLSPAGLYFDKPIVLLTDRLTISAAERATMILKALPNVTHLGDTTNGAAATKIGKELANGWDYSIVSQQLEFLDGKDYEGTGIPPDVYIANTKEEIEAGKDKVLEAAIALF